jgi:hypothetical protein
MSVEQVNKFKNRNVFCYLFYSRKGEGGGEEAACFLFDLVTFCYFLLFVKILVSELILKWIFRINVDKKYILQWV